MVPPGQRPTDAGRRVSIPHGDRHVVKLHPPGVPPAVVEWELHRARVAHEAGLPVPVPGKVVTVDGAFGVVFERIDGPTMLDLLATHPQESGPLARLLAELHARVHECRVALTGRRGVLGSLIDAASNIPRDEKAVLETLLASLPDGDLLCHGDFHPGNVVLAADGPVIVDWEDAHGGSAEEDVARTVSVIEGAALPAGFAVALPPAARRSFREAYLDHSAALRSLDHDRLIAWVRIHDAVVAAT